MAIIVPKFGWISPEKRNDEQHLAHAAALAKMPVFSIPRFGKPEVGTKILLTDSWKHPNVVKAIGNPFIGWLQDTGCCVGVGGGNGVQTTVFMDAIVRKQREKIVLYFWPYNYGRSRQLAGMHGEGEGSLGSTFAASLKDDGGSAWLSTLSLPSVSTKRGMLSIGEQYELDWSDGKKAPQKVREEAKPHGIQSAPVTSGEGVRDAIRAGCAVLRAFGKFVNPETARVKNGAIVGTYNGNGGHQESWLGYWNHPQNGELIWEQNQWGANAYGSDPGGGPAGGCWVSLDEVDRAVRGQYAECYALSNYDGYPDSPLRVDWSTPETGMYA